VLRGRLVTLRPFRSEELPAFAQSRPHARRERLKQRVAHSGELVDGLLDLAIEAEGRLVGDIGARHPPESSPPGVFDVGIELFRAADRGRGLGREALGLLTGHLFDSGLAERVQGSTAVWNAPMRRVFELLGYVEEGVMRSFMPSRAGSREDYVLYGVTRAEWSARAGAAPARAAAPRIAAASPVLAVRDLERSASWFVRVLGCERSDPDPGNWAFCRAGEVTFMLGRCPDAPPASEIGDHSYVAYVLVDDVDAVHARALAEGAEVLKPPTDEPWGCRELALRTPDGHRLTLAQPSGARRSGRSALGG